MCVRCRAGHREFRHHVSYQQFYAGCDFVYNGTHGNIVGGSVAYNSSMTQLVGRDSDDRADFADDRDAFMPDALYFPRAARRSASFEGRFRPLPAPDLGAVAVREAVARAGCEPREIDEVILGNVLSAGVGQAPARQAALRAGLPPTVAALTVNKVCGSGLKAVMLAAQGVRCGDVDLVVAGGMESMSQAGWVLPRDAPALGDRPLDRFDDARRADVPVQQAIDGRNRGRARRASRHFARGAGSLSRWKAIAGRSRPPKPGHSPRRSFRSPCGVGPTK